IFYDESFEVVGSHALLVAVNAQRSMDVRCFDIPSKFGFPGRITCYENVLHLNPNLYIECGRGAFRYNLTSCSEQRDLDSALAEFYDLMTKSVAAFARRKPLVMSLTAGFDSRTALSACRGVS